MRIRLYSVVKSAMEPSDLSRFSSARRGASVAVAMTAPAYDSNRSAPMPATSAG